MEPEKHTQSATHAAQDGRHKLWVRVQTRTRCGSSGGENRGLHWSKLPKLNLPGYNFASIKTPYNGVWEAPLNGSALPPLTSGFYRYRLP